MKQESKSGEPPVVAEADRRTERPVPEEDAGRAGCRRVLPDGEVVERAVQEAADFGEELPADECRRIVDGTIDVRLRSEMDDATRPVLCERRMHSRRVGDVALEKHMAAPETKDRTNRDRT